MKNKEFSRQDIQKAIKVVRSLPTRPDLDIDIDSTSKVTANLEYLYNKLPKTRHKFFKSRAEKKEEYESIHSLGTEPVPVGNTNRLIFHPPSSLEFQIKPGGACGSSEKNFNITIIDTTTIINLKNYTDSLCRTRLKINVVDVPKNPDIAPHKYQEFVSADPEDKFTNSSVIIIKNNETQEQRIYQWKIVDNIIELLESEPVVK